MEPNPSPNPEYWRKSANIGIHLAYTYNKDIFKKTRTKTSIRYAKENDREKTERRRERERKVGGEI